MEPFSEITKRPHCSGAYSKHTTTMTQPPSYFAQIILAQSTGSGPDLDFSKLFPSGAETPDGTTAKVRLWNNTGSTVEIDLALSGVTFPGKIPSSSAYANPLSIESGGSAYLAAIYNNNKARWDFVSIVNGY